MRPVSFLLLALLSIGIATMTTSGQAQSSPTFLDFIRAQAAHMRANDAPPASLKAWQTRRAAIRTQLLKAWGGFPTPPVPLQPAVLGVLHREGYRVEKIVFQTLPDVWMTANAYVPDRPGRLPAVLCVHGHWRGAKQDPVVQARCIGLAKLGFFALAVDAFGAGERGVGKALGEYHGEMTAATLFPVGRPLSGLQVYENSRAVDYLLTRPEVDGTKIGITGASGGGNQTMYAGAWDERFKAAVPVCSVGNYQAYLGGACCLCEVVPGALQFTEEGGILGMVAPRALLVINATRDAPQFSVEAAKKSIAWAAPIYDLFGKPQNLRHTTFESGHDYSQPMREAMYGWMTRHLKGEGDGSPIPEPPIKTEDPETLRCYPGDSRPPNWLTLPGFAAREGQRRLAEIALPSDADTWKRQAARIKATLERDVLGNTKPLSPASRHSAVDPESLAFESEPGIRLTLRRLAGNAPSPREIVVILNTEDAPDPDTAALAKAATTQTRTVYALSLRATGPTAVPNDRIGHAPDHNSAEWSLWLGRPLLGQWTRDVRAALDTLSLSVSRRPAFTVVGIGSAGVAAICAGALDTRIRQVVAAGLPVSYLRSTPYEGQRLGIMAPGIVRGAGDIPHLAGLIAPRNLVIAGGVDGTGKALEEAALQRAFDFTRQTYALLKAPEALNVSASSDLAAHLGRKR